MNCVICHGIEINRQQVNEEYMDGNDIIYIPVEVLVCKTCGERYYDRRSKQYLEKIRTSLNGNKIELKEIGKVKILTV